MESNAIINLIECHFVSEIVYKVTLWINQKEKNGMIDEILVVIESLRVAGAERVNAVIAGDIGQLLRRASESDNARMKFRQIPPQLSDCIPLGINGDKVGLNRERVIVGAMHECRHSLELGRTNVWTIGVSKIDQIPMARIQLLVAHCTPVSRIDQCKRLLTDLCRTFA